MKVNCDNCVCRLNSECENEPLSVARQSVSSDQHLCVCLVSNKTFILTYSLDPSLLEARRNSFKFCNYFIALMRMWIKSILACLQLFTFATSCFATHSATGRCSHMSILCHHKVLLSFHHRLTGFETGLLPIAAFVSAARRDVTHVNSTTLISRRCVSQRQRHTYYYQVYLEKTISMRAVKLLSQECR